MLKTIKPRNFADFLILSRFVDVENLFTDFKSKFVGFGNRLGLAKTRKTTINYTRFFRCWFVL